MVRPTPLCTIIQALKYTVQRYLNLNYRIIYSSGHRKPRQESSYEWNIYEQDTL